MQKVDSFLALNNIHKKDKDTDLVRQKRQKAPLPKHRNSEVNFLNVSSFLSPHLLPSAKLNESATTLTRQKGNSSSMEREREWCEGRPVSREMIYRDLSERIIRVTKTPEQLQRELNNMDSSQIIKRHMLNRSLNNALKSDHRINLKNRPAFNPNTRNKTGIA